MVSLAEVIPNEWYISIVCSCGERLILFQDLTKGKGSLDGSFEITCAACGQRGCFPAQHYQYEPQNKPQRTNVERTLCRAS